MPDNILLADAHTRIHLHTTLGMDRFRLMEIRGRERISHPYSFRLKLRTTAIDTITPAEMIGQSVTASFELPDPSWISILTGASGTPQRDFCGILSHVSYNGVDDRDRYFTAILRPRLWQLGLNSRFRMFSQMTTQEIVNAVLGVMNVDWRLSTPTVAHNYCVQYGESDLAFISRLLEEDGLFYFFEHQYDDQAITFADRTERLVITDSIDAANADDSSVADDSPTPVVPIYIYDDVRGGVRDSMRVNRWVQKRSMVPEAVRSLDRHFQRPSSFADDTRSRTPDAVTTSCMMHYPSRVAQRVDDISPAGDVRDQTSLLDASATHDANVRTQRLSFLASEYAGGGDVAVMSPGKKFQIMRDAVPDSTDYYLTEIEHLVRLSTGTHSNPQPEELTYKNRFKCQSVTQPYRPSRRTAKPVISGLVPATVVVDGSQSSDDICIDKFGRVKVRFPWQDTSDSSSCWVRVSQFWAGPRWGAFFWPRKDHEVLIGFEHGDPDRPLIVGSVYNANNLPPLELPTFKLSGGIHSCTHKSANPTENTSSIVFHDQRGGEYLAIHSETYLAVSNETTGVTWSAGKEISFNGHHWLFSAVGGSGGGGNDLSGNDQSSDPAYKSPYEDDDNQAYNVSDMFKNLFLGNNRGAIKFTVGDSYSKTFGSNYESKFGCNIWLGCDPVEFVEYAVDKWGGAAKGALGPMVPMLLGAGGQGATLFGGKHDLHYGTAVECHRGNTVNKLDASFFDADDKYTIGNCNTLLDHVVKRLAEILVVLMLLMDCLMMLLTKAAISHLGKHWKGFISFSEVWSLNILPRLQGLLEYVESKNGAWDALVQCMKDALEGAEKALAAVIRAVTSTGESAGVKRDAAKDDVEEAVDGLATALRRTASCVDEE